MVHRFRVWAIGVNSLILEVRNTGSMDDGLTKTKDDLIHGQSECRSVQDLSLFLMRFSCRQKKDEAEGEIAIGQC